MAVSLYQQQRAQEEEEEKPRGNIRELLISSIRILGRCNENISSRKRVSNIKSGIWLFLCQKGATLDFCFMFNKNTATTDSSPSSESCCSFNFAPYIKLTKQTYGQTESTTASLLDCVAENSYAFLYHPLVRNECRRREQETDLVVQGCRLAQWLSDGHNVSISPSRNRMCVDIYLYNATTTSDVTSLMDVPLHRNRPTTLFNYPTAPHKIKPSVRHLLLLLLLSCHYIEYILTN